MRRLLFTGLAVVTLSLSGCMVPFASTGGGGTGSSESSSDTGGSGTADISVMINGDAVTLPDPYACEDDSPELSFTAGDVENIDDDTEYLSLVIDTSTKEVTTLNLHTADVDAVLPKDFDVVRNGDKWTATGTIKAKVAGDSSWDDAAQIDVTASCS